MQKGTSRKDKKIKMEISDFYYDILFFVALKK